MPSRRLEDDKKRLIVREMRDNLLQPPPNLSFAKSKPAIG
jgi:hypothetical protein